MSGKGTKHQKQRSGYSNFATQLQEPFAIREELERTEDFDELRELRNQAQTIKISNARNKLVKDIESKMSVVAKELAEISEERREKRIETERLEKELEREMKKIDSSVSTITLDRIERRLGALEDRGANIDEALSLLEGKRISIEEQEFEYNPDF